MISSRDLLNLYKAERPFIQQALDLAEHFAEVRKAQSEKGLDWARAKVLFKAMLQDEHDGGHRVEEITRRADTTSEYATLMNKKNFSSETRTDADAFPGARIAEPASLSLRRGNDAGSTFLGPAVKVSRGQPSARDGETWPVESLVAPGPSIPEPVLAPAGEPVAAVAVDPIEATGSQIEAAPPGGVGAEDGDAAMPVAGHSIPDDLSIPEFLRRPLPEAVE